MVLGVNMQGIRRDAMLELLDGARALVRRVCSEVATVYEEGGGEAMEKADGSPLTQADLLAHRILAEGLAQLSPQLPVVSEEDETATDGQSPHYWLIDPIDGTREFISRTGEFSTNVALISGGEAVWGCIGAPTTGKIHEGGKKFGSRCWQGMRPQTLESAAASMQQCRVLVSRSHPDEKTQALLTALEGHFAAVLRQPQGSSLKFCALAEGKADLYPRMVGISPWDIAAGQAILEGAGGGLLLLSGAAPSYRSDDRSPLPAFVAFADARPDWPRIVRQAAV